VVATLRARISTLQRWWRGQLQVWRAREKLLARKWVRVEHALQTAEQRAGGAARYPYVPALSMREMRRQLAKDYRNRRG
jgi:hypothetical protein